MILYNPNITTIYQYHFQWYHYVNHIVYSPSMTYSNILSHIITQHIQLLKNQFNWESWIAIRKPVEVRGEGIPTSRE